MLDCADAVTWLKKRMKGSAHLAILDPPYESQEGYRAIGTTTRLQTWFDTVSYDYLGTVASELFRVLKGKSHCYVFADIHAAIELVPRFVAAGFRFWGAPVWDKVKMGTGYHYRRSYELVLFFEKGSGKPLNDAKGIRDVFAFPLETPKHRQRYPAEKPVGLCELFVEQSSCRGQVVIDPFMGRACPVGVVAEHKGRVFWGCDKLVEAVDCAKMEVSLARDLFASQPPLPLLAEQVVEPS